MKKIFKSFLLATALLSPALLFNCAEEQLPAGGQLSLVRQHLQLQTTSASFGFNTNLSQTISVAGEHTPWALTGLPEWLSASATTGQGAATITLTAKENTSVDEARAAVLTFASTAGDYQYSKTISVSQPAATIYLTPSASTLSCLPKGEMKDVTIVSNVDWKATSSESWLTVKKASNTELQLTATENLGQTRMATIHLMRIGTTTTITTLSVTQAEAGVTGSTDNIAFMADGEAKTTTFHAEASWTASVSDAAWLRVTPASGSDGDATITITATANASANARSGFVYVKIGSATKLAVPVSQEGVKFSVSASTLTLKSTTESATLNVTANAAWQVVSKPTWVKVTLPEALVGTNVLTLTPQDNPNTTPRTGQLIIGREGFSGNQTITLTQAGKTFGDLTAQMDFPVTGGAQSLTIDTDGAWTASTSASWIHLSPTSGQGGGQLQVSVDANPDKEERNETITVTVGKTAQTITIHQVGRYINLSCDDVISKSTPSTVNLSINSNLSWTVSSDVDWLTLANKQGEGDATLMISVADNPSVNARTGSITVQSGEVTQAFSFTQPGRTLTVSTTSLSFTSGGGTSETITVTTDGTFEVTASEDWMTIKQNGNTFTVTTALTNSVNERSGTVTVALTGLTGEEKLERIITVSQAGATLEVSESSLSFPAAGGMSEAITVATSGTYEVTASEKWMTVNKSGNTFTVTAATSNSINKRSGTVTISLTGLTGEEKLEQTITIEQAPLTLTVDKTAIIVPPSGGTSEVITVTTDGSYRVTTSDDWLTINKTGNAFTVIASENTSSGRMATITVVLTNLVDGENLTRTVTVMQAKNELVDLCPDNNHPHLIDLGLDVKWACCNVGASTPNDYGGYYAWGETEEKTMYAWSNYKWCNGTSSSITKYGCGQYGIYDELRQLEYSDDAARVHWGAHWRMPTREECEALLNCTSEWTTINGVFGRMFTGPNGASIFLPAAGRRINSDLSDAGSYGNYWSSRVKNMDEWSAYQLEFSQNGLPNELFNGIFNAERFRGQSVRPVVGPYLEVSPASLSFPSDASSAVINVSTNQDYTISASDSWIKATTSKDKQTVTVTATANTGAERTVYITVSGGGLTETVKVTQAKYVEHDPLGLCPDTNHPHMIDLGLSVKWACCNVGASSPIDYGGYYAWGETEEKTTYDWSTYKWCNGSETSLTKYCTNSSYGTVDNKKLLALSDNVARVKWGGSWRMPTFDEIHELMNNTISTWITLNGVCGIQIRSRTNGNSIFLPAAGLRWSGELLIAGSDGYYWSSTLLESGPNYAYIFGFNSDDTSWSSSGYRSNGNSVRPVR